MIHKYESENKKINELNRLLKIQIKNMEGKALNFSSKLIMVEVQLGIEKDKNRKLLHTLEQLKTEKVKKSKNYLTKIIVSLFRRWNC